MRGIYAITNIFTDTVYYGQSKNIQDRINHHKAALKRKEHRNIHMQRAWNKYGSSVFIFTPLQIIEDISINLTPIETKYKNNAYFLGLKVYNIREPETKSPLSEETKQKISKAHIGMRASEETKKKISDSHKGIKTCLGRKISEESKLKMSIAKLGKKASKETRLKMSVANKNYRLRSIKWI